MMLMYDTAARCDELLRLRLCDMQAEGKQPVVYLTGKGSKTRVVPLMPRTVEHYSRYLSCFHKDACMTDTDFIFYTVIHHKRNAMSPDTPALFMRQYGNSARLECREFPARMHPHVLRHTRAIHLYRNGVPLELLSQFLGHSSVETTRIYAFADTEMKRKAIEKADKFLQISKSSDFPIWKDDEEMILKLSGLK